MSSFGNKPTLIGSQIMAHRSLHCVLEFPSTFLFLCEDAIRLGITTYGKLLIDSADGVDLSLVHLKSSLEPPGTLNSRRTPYEPAGPSYMSQWREDKPWLREEETLKKLFPHHWPFLLVLINHLQGGTLDHNNSGSRRQMVGGYYVQSKN